ncbi:hypothetical protein HaLaN_01370 [Haematococcus lacustris]|uniref:Uncharacterized protein n=1 Tax=Haematococcus lacustris TaxID=44745 RepID=A0A699Y945_HAELA|nr:hypothetical protein HaLaN_01370 [Haematococcus lacustris]
MKARTLQAVPEYVPNRPSGQHATVCQHGVPACKLRPGVGPVASMPRPCCASGGNSQLQRDNLRKQDTEPLTKGMCVSKSYRFSSSPGYTHTRMDELKWALGTLAVALSTRISHPVASRRRDSFVASTLLLPNRALSADMMRAAASFVGSFVAVGTHTAAMRQPLVLRLQGRATACQLGAASQLRHLATGTTERGTSAAPSCSEDPTARQPGWRPNTPNALQPGAGTATIPLPQPQAKGRPREAGLGRAVDCTFSTADSSGVGRQHWR